MHGEYRGLALLLQVVDGRLGDAIVEQALALAARELIVEGIRIEAVGDIVAVAVLVDVARLPVEPVDPLLAGRVGVLLDGDGVRRTVLGAQVHALPHVEQLAAGPLVPALGRVGVDDVAVDHPGTHIPAAADDPVDTQVTGGLGDVGVAGGGDRYRAFPADAGVEPHRDRRRAHAARPGAQRDTATTDHRAGTGGAGDDHVAAGIEVDVAVAGGHPLQRRTPRGIDVHVAVIRHRAEGIAGIDRKVVDAADRVDVDTIGGDTGAVAHTGHGAGVHCDTAVGRDNPTTECQP